MKKNILKLKIIMTNISRIITSFIFVNLNFSFFNKVLGISLQNNQIVELSCYAQVSQPQPDRNIFEFKNVLIICVPIAIIIGIITIIIKKKKSKKEEKNVKKD